MNVAVELARPFPKKYVQQVQSADYIAHHIIEQRLVHIFGETPETEIVREIYDDGKLTGCLMRMTVPGRKPVMEYGASDNPQSKTNGDRAKDSASDAYKRCAMRLTVGLHLWSGEHYFLFDALTKKEGTDEAPAPRAPSEGSSPQQTTNPPRRNDPAPPAASPEPVRPVSKEEVVPSADESGEELSEEGRSSPVLVAKRMQVKILMQDKTPDNIDSLSEKELEALIGKHSKGGKK